MYIQSHALEPTKNIVKQLFETCGIPCEVSFASGETNRFGIGPPRFQVRFHSDEVLALSLNEFALGKAYVEGKFDIEGDMLSLLDIREYLPSKKGNLGVVLKFIHNLLFKPPTLVNKGAIASHYTFGDDLYLSFIDKKYRFYSQCLFSSDDETLERAAERKLEVMYEALRLKPGMRLLDIGAGWGGVQEYCGPRGVHVSSLTLTEDSRRFTQGVIDRLGLENCSVHIEDFLNHQPRELFDAVVILGVIEHIPYYRKFSRRLWECLKPGGRLYLDASAAIEKYDLTDFTRHFVWHGTHSFLCVQDLVQELLFHGMEVVEVKRETHDYELTMKHWALRFEENREKIIQNWGDEIYRIFRIYLWGGCHALRENSMQAYHVVAEKNASPGPRPGTFRRANHFIHSLV